MTGILIFALKHWRYLAGAAVLTLYLVIVAHMMYINLHAMLQERGAQLTGEQIQTLAMQVIGTLLYLATTAVVWWFGTRPTKKENDK